MTESRYTEVVEKSMQVVPLSIKIALGVVIGVPFLVVAFRHVAASRASCTLIDAAEFIRQEAVERDISDDEFVQTLINNLLAVATITPLLASNAMKLPRLDMTKAQRAAHNQKFQEFTKANTWICAPLSEASLALIELEWFATPLSFRALLRTGLIMVFKPLIRNLLGYEIMVPPNDQIEDTVQDLESCAQGAREYYHVQHAPA